MSILEAKVSVSARLPVEKQDSSVHLIDGMALIQAMKAGGSNTFGEFADKFYAIVIMNHFSILILIELMWFSINTATFL